jgi:mRNA-degrading endonuclease toxin of MazEF toxin-antitoxin module
MSSQNSTQTKKPNFIKNFLDWFKLKPRINNLKISPNFSQREIWYCHFGKNIGFEIDGKKSQFLRGVLVFKKLSKETFIGIPLTLKPKQGSWYYPSFVDNKNGSYIFSQVKTIDSERLFSRIERIDTKEFDKIKTTFLQFLS